MLLPSTEGLSQLTDILAARLGRSRKRRRALCFSSLLSSASSVFFVVEPLQLSRLPGAATVTAPAVSVSRKTFERDVHQVT